MSGLRIASNLTLPQDAVTQTFAFLARRGAGKTNGAKVIAERMIDAGHPVVILDPVGVVREMHDMIDPGLQGRVESLAEDLRAALSPGEGEQKGAET